MLDIKLSGRNLFVTCRCHISTTRHSLTLSSSAIGLVLSACDFSSYLLCGNQQMENHFHEYVKCNLVYECFSFLLVHSPAMTCIYIAEVQNYNRQQWAVNITSAQS